MHVKLRKHMNVTRRKIHNNGAFVGLVTMHVQLTSSNDAFRNTLNVNNGLNMLNSDLTQVIFCFRVEAL